MGRGTWGPVVDQLETGLNDLKLIRYENRPNFYLRIYDRDLKRNVFRVLNTADPVTAQRTYQEVYKNYLQNPVVKKADKKTMIQLVDLWINHVEGREKRNEIEEKTMVAKITTIKNGVLSYLINKKLLRVSDINFRKDFSDYVNWRIEKGYKRSTIETEIKHIKEWVRFLHQKGYIKDPTIELTIPRQTYKAKEEEGSIQSFTDDQLEEISTEIIERITKTKGEEKLRWQLIGFFTQMMEESGMRTDELYWITFGQCRVRGEEKYHKSECAVDIKISKTGPRTTIFMSPVISSLVQLYTSMGVKILPDTPLWLNPATGKRFYRGWFAHWFRVILDGLGYDHSYRLYSYRHTMITNSILKGISLYNIGRLVGNSQNEIQKTYDHVILEYQSKDILNKERGEEEDTFQSIVG